MKFTAPHMSPILSPKAFTSYIPLCRFLRKPSGYTINVRHRLYIRQLSAGLSDTTVIVAYSPRWRILYVLPSLLGYLATTLKAFYRSMNNRLNQTRLQPIVIVVAGCVTFFLEHTSQSHARRPRGNSFPFFALATFRQAYKVVVPILRSQHRTRISCP